MPYSDISQLADKWYSGNLVLRDLGRLLIKSAVKRTNVLIFQPNDANGISLVADRITYPSFFESFSFDDLTTILQMIMNETQVIEKDNILVDVDLGTDQHTITLDQSVLTVPWLMLVLLRVEIDLSEQAPNE